MPEYFIQNEILTNLADAIRSKLKEDEQNLLTPPQMVDAIHNLGGARGYCT